MSSPIARQQPLPPTARAVSYCRKHLGPHSKLGWYKLHAGSTSEVTAACSCGNIADGRQSFPSHPQASLKHSGSHCPS